MYTSGYMEKQNLKKAILRTLAYFDLNSYPLTAVEINQWLYELYNPDLVDLLALLEDMKRQNELQEKYGYFYLPGREKIVEKRRCSLVISELKLKKARYAAKFVRGVPFLKAIFVCNTVAAGTALDDSDIDFFIIAKSSRLWLVRFFTNIILRLFGLRTYGDKQRDKICLSFFVDDNNLNLEKLKAAETDIHFAYWAVQMVPVYDPENYWKKFLSANYWLKKYVPNLSNNLVFLNLIGSGKILMIWKKFWETVWSGVYGDLLEKQARDWQMLKMKLSVQEKSKIKDNSVVLDSGVIKLHENDTRLDCAQAWQARSQEIVNSL